MVKLALIGVMVAGYVGYVVAGGGYVPLVSAEVRSQATANNTLPTKTDADTLALAFADRVLEFKRVAESDDALADEEILEYREKISSSFVVAYNAIEKIERAGDVAATVDARELMEGAIGEYMASHGANEDLVITRDLDTYSRFMTKVLIARAVSGADAE